MKKILAAVFISLLLFMSSSHAIPSNFFLQPTCHDDVTMLPIFQLSIKAGDQEIQYGTTFLVDKDMWATAFHVVSNSTRVELKYYIVLPNGSEIEAEILQTDPISDIAILYAPSGNMKPMAQLSTITERYEPVWNIGLPRVTARAMISFEGIILSVVDDIFLQSSALAFGGMSGGPQVRCNGDKLEVVGVIIKTTMHLFQIVKEELEDGTIIKHRYYQAEGSKTSPHVAKAMVEVFSGMMDNE